MKTFKFGSLLLTASLLFTSAGSPALLKAQDAAPVLKYTDWLDAAGKGDAEKAFMVGIGYYYAMYGAPKDNAKARQWLLKAANGGHARAALVLGDMYYAGRGVRANKAEALKWYRKAADNGEPEAAEKVGDMYYYGESVRKDYSAAAAWYRKAADAGSGTAASKLGRMYMLGEGVKTDNSAALKLLVNTGEPRDSVFIAEIYRAGLNGVKKDLAKAAEWLVKGATAGDTASMQMLAEAYYAGDGVRRDYGEAYKWLAVVTSREKNPDGTALMKRAASRMNSSELAAAKKKAAQAIREYK
ncbi:MAG: tetratricopeptide repeat protein [Elusimicrobiales bacterium]|nr:tetratricopeptide repeat protein [Elusimicrobiales bacterium]